MPDTSTGKRAAVPQVLRSIAAELREHPERWTQGSASRAAAGQSIGVDGAFTDAACSWCAVGFLVREFGGPEDMQWRDYPVTQFLSDALGGHEPEAVFEWNDADGRTAFEVADAFDAAAVIAEGDEDRG